jgi:hypothetical protein
MRVTSTTNGGLALSLIFLNSLVSSMHQCLCLSLLYDNQVFIKNFRLELDGLNVIASDKNLFTLAKVAISRRDYYLA